METSGSMLNMTVGELAAESPRAIRVFESWRIDYCCGGSTPLADACTAVGRSMDEFFTALEATAGAPLPIALADGITLAELAREIVERYHRYTREELDTLRTLGEKVNGVHGSRHPELVEVESLIGALVSDMLPHMLKEEQVLFPYVGQLEEAALDGREPLTPFFGTVKNPVRMMMLEHDRVGDLLRRLRGVTGGFQVPDDACFSYRELYRRLAELESKTHEHIHVENNIFFPKAVALEENVGKLGIAPAETSCCGTR